MKRGAIVLVVACGCRTDPPAVAADAAVDVVDAADAGSDAKNEDAGEEAAPSLYVPPPEPTYARLAERAPDPVTYPVPKDDEWRAATPVALERQTRACSARTTRGWLRVECESPRGAGVSLLGGSRDGLYLATAERMAIVTLPMRRGDRRVVQVTNAMPRAAWGYGDMTAEYGPPQIVGGQVLSIAWLDTAGPVVTVTEQRGALE